MKRKTIALFLSALITLTLAACQPKAPPPASTSEPLAGKEETPSVPEPPADPTQRTISTAEELLAFSQWTNETPLEQQEGITWTLTADLDLTGTNWTPAGKGDYDPGPAAWTGGFAGTFEGDGHTVKGIKVSGTNPAHTGGFFDVLAKGAVVRNLHVEGEVTGENCVGGLAGTGSASGLAWDDAHAPALVSGCSFTGTVRGTRDAAGGLMGCSGEETVIRRCQAEGEVYGASTLGGLIGWLASDAVIEESSFTGTVISDLPARNAENFGLPLSEGQPEYGPGEIQITAVGGFVGGSYGGRVENCWSDAALVTNAPCSMSGIFIGYHSGADPGCYYNLEKAGSWTPGYAYPGSSSVFAVKGLKGEEILDTASYQGWDFTAAWEMGEEGPRLKRQK